MPTRFSRSMDDQDRLRFEHDFRQFQFFRQFQSRQSRHVQQSVDQFVLFARRHFQIVGSPQERHPGIGIKILERPNLRRCNRQAARNDQHRIFQRHMFFAAAQRSAQFPDLFNRFKFDFQAEFPIATFIPRQRLGDAFVVAENANSSGCTNRRKQQLTQIVRQSISMRGQTVGHRSRHRTSVWSSADEVRQNSPIFIVVNIIEFSGLQLQGLEFAPFAVRSSLAM